MLYRVLYIEFGFYVVRTHTQSRTLLLLNVPGMKTESGRRVARQQQQCTTHSARWRDYRTASITACYYTLSRCKVWPSPF